MILFALYLWLVYVTYVLRYILLKNKQKNRSAHISTAGLMNRN